MNQDDTTSETGSVDEMWMWIGMCQCLSASVCICVWWQVSKIVNGEERSQQASKARQMTERQASSRNMDGSSTLDSQTGAQTKTDTDTEPEPEPTQTRTQTQMPLQRKRESHTVSVRCTDA